MFGLGSGSKPKVDRAAALAAIPMRNTIIERTEIAPGKIFLTGPIPKTRFKRWFGTKNTKKQYWLDDLGDGVWQSCNGKNSVEDIMRDFQRRHGVTLREAEVSVTTFLNMLTRRNLVALAVGRPLRTRLGKERRHGRKRKR